MTVRLVETARIRRRPSITARLLTKIRKARKR